MGCRIVIEDTPAGPRIAVGAMREETKFAFDRKVIWRVQPLARKTFRLNRRANQLYQLAPSHPDEGRIASRHERGSRCGGRSSAGAQIARTTNGAVADGEVVWSWRPDAGVKLRGGIRQATVAKKPGHRGELEVSRNPSRREGRSVSAEPVCSCAFLCTILHTRPRVQRAPGFPCALCSQEGERNPKLGQHHAARMRSACLCGRISNCHRPLSIRTGAGDPVRRGFSAQSLPPLEYWIARSSRATTSGKAV